MGGGEGPRQHRERPPPPRTPASGSLPRPALGGPSKWGRGLKERIPGHRREGVGVARPLLGPGVGNGSPLEPLCLQAAQHWALAGNTKGAVRTAQVREPPRLLGVVVRLPNGRSPARAGCCLGHTSAHAPSLPACSASPVPPPPGGRGFLVVRAQEEVSVLTPPSLRSDWTTEVRAATRLAVEDASLFRAVLICRCKAGFGE